ncbi:uncharacterized protein DS421_13g403860 [Arachis hypogaea]|nr:uncharacterized protein DS421_13g403860 [Arachis hypogaea]
MHVTHCDRRASVFVVEELEPFKGWGGGSFCVQLSDTVFKVYEMEFPPIPDESLWAEWHGTMLRPNPVMHRKATGRPVSTRFWNDMDETERHEKWCGLCRQVGYSRRGCPNQPTRDA